MFRVAIVGRPNVGKSTLFNRLTRTRKALVGSRPGLTRDRLSEIANWDGKRFEVIDTGGIVPDDKEEIPEKVLQQSEIAIEEANLILFVVDGRQGVTPLDKDLATLLRTRGIEPLLIVNKVDVPGLEAEAFQFHALGFKQLYLVSADHKVGLTPLMDHILKQVPESPATAEEEVIRVAIIGRPNVGKSSLLNRVTGKERAIVTATPGTTRDAIDTDVTVDGSPYRLIDTAGIRRKGKTVEMEEKLSVIMARKSMERSDVVLLVLEASEGPQKLDATIGGYAEEVGVSIILVANKCDLVPTDGVNQAGMERAFRARMRFLDYAPMIFVSAKTGEKIPEVFELVRRAYQGRMIRVPTSELNQYLEREVESRLLPEGSSRRHPLKFACQVSIAPPTFVLFTRTRKLHFSARRFLRNRLRRAYEFYATPIRILLRQPGKRRAS